MEKLTKIASEHIEGWSETVWPVGEVMGDIGCHMDWAGIHAVNIHSVDEPEPVEEGWVVEVTAQINRWRSSDDDDDVESVTIETYYVTIDSDGKVIEVDS